MNAMKMLRVALAGLLVSLGVLSPLRAAPPWGPPVMLDPRTPLEISQLRQDPVDGKVFLPVLFDLATNSLELGRIDMTPLHGRERWTSQRPGGVIAAEAGSASLVRD